MGWVPPGCIFIYFFLSVTFPVTVCHLLPSPCPRPPREHVPQGTQAPPLFILVGSAAALHLFEVLKASQHRACLCAGGWSFF